MRLQQKIVPCLWFDEQAEEAAAFFSEIFPDSRIIRVTRYGEAGFEFHGKAPGTAMTVAFELHGQPSRRSMVGRYSASTRPFPCRCCVAIRRRSITTGAGWVKAGRRRRSRVAG